MGYNVGDGTAAAPNHYSFPAGLKLSQEAIEMASGFVDTDAAESVRRRLRFPVGNARLANSRRGRRRMRRCRNDPKTRTRMPGHHELLAVRSAVSNLGEAGADILNGDNVQVVASIWIV